MGELITIENITFDYHNALDAFGYLPEEENLGLMMMEFPEGMLRTALREIGIEGKYGKILPHMDTYDDSIHVGSSHECINADTQIVFMNHFFEKRRKYHNVNYTGMDVFWLFHDSRHALEDVYCNEVNQIYSHTEHERLVEGIELANMHGYSMNGLTLFNLKNAWKGRWNFRERDNMQKFDLMYFYNRLTDFEKIRYEILEEREDLGPRIISDEHVAEYLYYKDDE